MHPTALRRGLFRVIMMNKKPLHLAACCWPSLRPFTQWLPRKTRRRREAVSGAEVIIDGTRKMLDGSGLTGRPGLQVLAADQMADCG
jgi:hypothetical protein